MAQRLNERRVDAVKLARLGQMLEGEIDLAAMPRLASLLVDTEGAARLRLRFGIDAQGQPGVHGQVSATLRMICQRCLDSVSLDVDAPVSLAIVTSPEQARELAEVYEPLLVGEEPVALAALAEEELILALPIVAMHAPEQCEAAMPVRDALTEEPDSVAPAQERARRQNPFAVLEALRRKR